MEEKQEKKIVQKKTSLRKVKLIDYKPVDGKYPAYDVDTLDGFWIEILNLEKVTANVFEIEESKIGDPLQYHTEFIQGHAYTTEQIQLALWKSGLFKENPENMNDFLVRLLKSGLRPISK